MSAENTPRCPAGVAQIVESDFMVVALINGHDQHPPASGKSFPANALADGRYQLPGLDVPSTQCVAALGRQVISILTEAEGKKPGDIALQFDSTGACREVCQINQRRVGSFGPCQE